MEPAQELYDAMPTAKPAWDDLGDVTKDVWRGYVGKGVMVHNYRAGVTFSYEFEKLLVERILPLCSAEEIALLYKNHDPSWPFPVSAVEPSSAVGKILELREPVPVEKPVTVQGYITVEEAGMLVALTEYDLTVKPKGVTIQQAMEEAMTPAPPPFDEETEAMLAAPLVDNTVKAAEHAKAFNDLANEVLPPPPADVVVQALAETFLPAPPPKPLSLKERMALKKGT